MTEDDANEILEEDGMTAEFPSDELVQTIPVDSNPTDENARPEREDAAAITVVGLGASAGGVQALQEFFIGAPPDSGMAYLIMLHLSSSHESQLVEMLSQATVMPVTQVQEAMTVEPDHIYVIPPSKHLIAEDGLLRLIEPDQPRGRRIAIDQFFRTLAEAHGPQSAGVILSGMGPDGVLGFKQLKEIGAVTVVQDPSEAEHDAMPRNAIATGLVDYILPAREIAKQIISYRDASRRMRLPIEAAPSPQQREDGPDTEAALVRILTLVREQTGHDFAYYKRATVLRLIGRRLQVNNLETLPAYLAFLRRQPEEVNDLLGDLLISVTQFFRDADVWTAMEHDVIPYLFENKGPNDEVRAWVCGCATGEEAYTLAILMLEHAARMERPPRIQIFATDMDVDAIVRAREGSYPDTIAADVTPERLRGWFYRDNGNYRIRKEVREIVLFALHDVLKDTPFSRLNLITCRNLLIYLNRNAQERVFDIFHFAIRPEGHLLLGASEAVDGASQLFATADKTRRIYIRRSLARTIPLVPPTLARLPSIPTFVPQAIAPIVIPGREQHPVSAGEMHRDILETYAPPSILVDEDHQILHLSNSAGRFLRFTGGEPTSNLMRIVHPDLRLDVSTAVYAATAEGRDQIRTAPAVLDSGSQARLVQITVRPVVKPVGARGYFLVLFEVLSDQTTMTPPASSDIVMPLQPDVARQLEQEIDRLQGQLRSSVEQYEASIEELRASNEELRAMNEEMRSATEELETSKEELQSVNEELSTVNQELKNRIIEVSHTNADLHNLLVSTDIATVFLDRELRIKRFTPAAESLFNVIPSDLGRPLSHMTHQLDYPALLSDAERVLLHLTPIEREVRSSNGRHQLARIRPYRTLEDRIDGVVLTFVDVTERKRAEAALQESEKRLTLALKATSMGTFIWYVKEDRSEPDAQMLALFGLPPNGTLSLTATMETLLHLDDRSRYFEAVERATDPRGSGELAEDIRVLLPSGGLRWLAINAQVDFDGEQPRMAGTALDITERKRSEADLAFLAEISQDLTRLTDIQDTIDRIGAKIGAYFDASLCAFGEVDENQQSFTIAYEWQREDTPSWKGMHRILDFHNEDLWRACHTGEAYAVRNAATEPRTNAVQMAALFIGSFLSVPLLRDDEWIFNLFIADTDPHDWRSDEIVLLREITSRIWLCLERARIEEALSDSEERFRAFVAASSDAIYRMSPDWEEMRFLNGKDFITSTAEPNRSWIETYIPSEDRQQVRRVIHKAIQTKTMFELEHRVRRADGTLGWTLSRAVPRLDDQGEIVEWFGTATDVTGRRQAEEAVREANAALERSNETLEERVAERTAEVSQMLTALEAALVARRQADAARQDVLRLLAEAEEEERRRLSRELHDQTGQHLTGLMLGLDTLRAAQPPDSQEAILAERLRQAAADLSQEVHQLAWDLRPAALDDLGLRETLISYVQDWKTRTGIEADFHAQNLDGERLRPEIETALYRVTQESLTNVARHSRADRASVVVMREPDGGALLMIEDNGAGFDVNAALLSPRLGLRGIRERIEIVGGTMEIESASDSGTTVIVRIPKAMAEPEANDV